MWELSVGVQRPKLLYLSPLGAPQRMPRLCWKMRGKASERWGREITEGGSLSCVGRLTCASGDPASFQKYRDKPISLTTHSLLWLVQGHSVEIVQYDDFCGTLKLTIGIFHCLLFSLPFRCYVKFALEMCIIFSVWMREYGVCDLVSVWIICPTVS